MRKTKRIPFLPAIPALLAFWTLPTMAMMGTEGPPPCESQACFTKAVSACKADASYMTNTAAGAQAQYAVQGATDDGACKLGMIYMRHPDADRTYKPLNFVVDPNGDIETQLKDAVRKCLSGGGEGDYQCSGSLLDASGGKGG